MPPAFPFSTQVLRTLAPTHLASYSSSRSVGDTISVKLEQFERADQQRINELYATLHALSLLYETHQASIEALAQSIRVFTRALGLSAFVSEMQQIGATIAPHQANITLLRVVHDVKGGSLTALVMMLQFLLLDDISRDDMYRIAFLVRDHRAIMRNCISDLDRAQSQYDRVENPHHIATIEQTWNKALYPLPKGTVKVKLDSQFHGIVSASNIEFSALRRTLYNVINNAVNYTTDGTIYLSILGLPDGQADDVRFVVCNTITREHRRTLQQRYPLGLGELFRGGFTTGGTGLGMRICGEFVSEDYGLVIEQCIEGRYVGAELRDEYFIAWFHWPAVTERALGLHRQASGA